MKRMALQWQEAGWVEDTVGVDSSSCGAACDSVLDVLGEVMLAVLVGT
jgi:hypothetical protein